MRRVLLVALLLAPGLNAGLAQAQQAQVPPVRAENAFARATAPRQTVGAAYMTLTSPAGDRLLSATSPAAARVELHTMTMDGAVMRMRELPDGLPLPAGQPVSLAPGGLHIMLVDLKAPLVAGQMVDVVLRFQNAPAMELRVPVAPVGAQGAGHAH
ncbi:MAG: copper chaperone PCu(A)C [Gemmatimonadaceae bacterium]|nr:copper chaperone PCu(A)C [Acetobacteraceae bacterium]